jgi:alkanesulfonate monooxygenase SsuD/methylene tetrahydromethanopterin reductase-like flavin-dependent oxidoreductase (luciferase family)
VSELGLLARFVHLAASILIVGGAALLILAGRSDRATAQRWQAQVERLTRALVVLALAAGILALAQQAASLEQRPTAAVEPAALWRVAVETQAGIVWIVRQSLLLLLGGFVFARADVSRRLDWPPGLLFPEEYGTRVAQIREWAKEAGRDPRAITLSVRVPMEVRSARAKAPAGDRPFFQGTAAEVLGDIQAYARLGVTHFVFDPVSPDLKAFLANMDRFADEVRPKAKAKASAARPPSGRAKPGSPRVR